MRQVVFLVVIFASLIASDANAKCALVSTREHFRYADIVVLVSIVEAHDGPVPWPFGIKDEGSLPGRIFKLRVVKAWKGALHVGDIIDGWTITPRGEDAYPQTEIDTPILAFLSKKSPYEIMSCNAANPARIDDVASELDRLVKGKTHGP